MLYKILYKLEDVKRHSKIYKPKNRTIKNSSSGLSNGGGKQTKKTTKNYKNKQLSIPKKNTNTEKQYRQNQTKERRSKLRKSTK